MWISLKLFKESGVDFQRGEHTFISVGDQSCDKAMALRVEVRFIDENDFVNKGKHFILKDNPD